MKLSDVEFVEYVPGGIRVIHNSCGHSFCVSHADSFCDGIECPECGEFVTKPENVSW